MKNNHLNLTLVFALSLWTGMLYGQYVATWESHGGPVTESPAVCSWAPNRLDVFVRGTDDALWTKSWDGSQWSGFSQLGNEKIASDPAAVAWGPNRIDVFVRGTDNMLYTKSWDGTRWTGYLGLGGPIIGGPAVCSWAPNRLDVFVRGMDNTLRTKSWDGNRWTGFTQLGNEKIASDPAAACWGPNRIDVFARGTDNNLYTKSWDGRRWTGYSGLGGPVQGGPAVCSQAPNRLDVFVRGADNTLRAKSWNGSQWSGFTQLGTNEISSDPAAVSWGLNRMDLFARGTDANLYHRWWNGIWMPISIVEGQLYREISKPEVYMVANGKKIWIPTPDALFNMGHNFNQVIIVPDGTLNQLPRFNIPTANATPGSLIFPPNRTSHFPLSGINTGVKVVSQNKEIQIVELRGWLRSDPNDDCSPEGSGYDYHYLLELDTDWALAQGMDIQKILRVGNIVNISKSMPNAVPRSMVSLPFVDIELNSWGWRNLFPTNNAPADWNAIVTGCPTAKWPFNPKNPKLGNPPLKAGQYVSVSGSLVTDSPHEVLHRPGTIISRWLGIWTGQQFDWEGSVPDWHPGVSTNTPDHYARWTEMHPPDIIEVIDERQPTKTIRGLALCARVAATPGPIIPSCEAVEFDIFPEAPRPPNTRIAFQELRGPECFFPWGEDINNGTWITPFNDHIHVKAKVCGGPIFGSPGRIKALYRVWWENIP